MLDMSKNFALQKATYKSLRVVAWALKQADGGRFFVFFINKNFIITVIVKVKMFKQNIIPWLNLKLYTLYNS